MGVVSEDESLLLAVSIGTLSIFVILDKAFRCLQHFIVLLTNVGDTERFVQYSKNSGSGTEFDNVVVTVTSGLNKVQAESLETGKPILRNVKPRRNLAGRDVTMKGMSRQ